MKDVWALRERDVTGQVKDFLEWRGWRLVRNNVTKVKDRTGRWTSYGENGMPDYTALFYLPGEKVGAACVMWLELKKPKGRPSPAQLAWHEQELARGGCVVVAREFEEFEAWYWEQFAWLHKQQGQQHLFQTR